MRTDIVDDNEERATLTFRLAHELERHNGFVTRAKVVHDCKRQRGTMATSLETLKTDSDEVAALTFGVLGGWNRRNLGDAGTLPDDATMHNRLRGCTKGVLNELTNEQPHADMHACTHLIVDRHRCRVMKYHYFSIETTGRHWVTAALRRS